MKRPPNKKETTKKRRASVFSNKRKRVNKRRVSYAIPFAATCSIQKWLASSRKIPLLIRGSISEALINKTALAVNLLKGAGYNVILVQERGLDSLSPHGLHGKNAFVIDADVIQRIPKNIPADLVVVGVCSDPFRFIAKD